MVLGIQRGLELRIQQELMRVGKDAPRPHKDDGFTMRDIWGGNSAVLQIGTKALAMAYLIVYAI